MAYMSQEKKAALAPGIKAVLKKYGMKGTIGVRHHSTLVVRITEGKLDLVTQYNQNGQKEYSARGYGKWNDQPCFTETNIHAGEGFTGDCQKFLKELVEAMDVGNHDRSDSQTDYFNVGWYVDIHIGNWEKPYVVTK